jgi:hypothetical protein
MILHTVGSSIYRATQFQWAPSRSFHDPNPPILIEGLGSEELTFTADSAVWSVGLSSLSGLNELSFTAGGAVWQVGLSSLSGVNELTFTADGVVWQAGSSSLSSVGNLSFIADGAVWSVGSNSLSGVSASLDELTFTASSAVWLVDVSVALSPQVDGPVLIGTSMVPQSLFGTG